MSTSRTPASGGRLGSPSSRPAPRHLGPHGPGGGGDDGGDDEEPPTDPNLNRAPANRPWDAGEKFGVSFLSIVLGCVIIAGAYLTGGLILVGGALCVLSPVIIVGCIILAISMGGSTHGPSGTSHATHLPPGVGDNNLGILSSVDTTLGVFALSDASKIPVFKFKWFGDPKPLYPWGRNLFGVLRFFNGAHMFCPPWLSVFWADLSLKKVKMSVGVTPHGSQTSREVPVSVWLRLQDASPETLYHLLNAHDGNVPENGEFTHGPADLKGVIADLIESGVNAYEGTITPENIIGDLVEPARMRHMLEWVNQGDKVDIDGTDHFGVKVQKLVFFSPKDPLGEQLERIRRQGKEGVNANLSAMAGGGGQGGGGDLFALAQGALVGWLSRLAGGNNQQPPGNDQGGNPPSGGGTGGSGAGGTQRRRRP